MSDELTSDLRIINGVTLSEELLDAIRLIVEDEMILDKYHHASEAALIMATINYTALGIDAKFFTTIIDITRIYKALIKIHNIN